MTSLPSLFRFLLAGPLGGLVAACAFASDLSAWPLRPSAQVDSGGLFLSAVVEGAADLPKVRLAPAPAAGQTSTFTRAQITELVREKAPALATTNWTGAAQVKVTRRSRTLEETELLELLTAALQGDHVKERGELELRFTRAWPNTPVPDEPFTVKILELPAAGVTPNFILRFELRAGSESVGRFQVPLQARVHREVWVAGSNLRRGQLLRDADLMRERRDVLTLRDPYPAPTLENPMLELAENVPSGTPLSVRSVRPRPIILRGRVVDALVSEGSLVITVKVEALEDGLPGQTVRVRNLKSKHEFRGKVQNEETILVTL